MGSTDMIIDQQNPDQSVESTDIDMPMVPELQQASRRLTMDSFARIKGLEQNSNLDERVAMLIGYFSSWTRLLWSRISRLSQKRFHSSSNGNESERGAHFSKNFTSDFSRTEIYFFETMLTPKWSRQEKGREGVWRIGAYSKWASRLVSFDFRF